MNYQINQANTYISKNINPKKSLKALIIIVCSLCCLMITAGKCNKMKTTVYYTVKFNSNGGSAVDSVRVASGGKVTKPTDPKRTNYTFVGWYSDEALTKAFDFNTAITENITLYAKWASSGIQQYTITFDVNGGSPVEPIKVNAGSKATAPAKPTKEGYVFVGWFKEAALTNEFDFTNEIITANITLYAAWKVYTKDIEGVVGLGKIPSDLTGYDEMSKSVLKYYPPGATVVGIYVTKTGKGDGSSWTKARGSVKEALNSITDANTTKVYFVLIGAGVYKAGSAMTMKNNVGIIGGWASTGGWIRKTTDTTELSGEGNYRVFDNTYKQSAPLTNTAVLYDAKLSDGKSNDNGGGIYNEYASPVITKVTFINNYAATSGGGMYNNNSSPILTNVTFINNRGRDSGGGGIWNSYSSPEISNSTFSGNVTTISGGGIFNDHSPCIITNVSFVGNNAEFGGGISNDFCSPVITNVIFSENGGVYGGGMYSSHGSSPIITNVMFSKNGAGTSGGGIYNAQSCPVLSNVTFSENESVNGGAICNSSSSLPVLTNVTFSGNKAQKNGGGIFNTIASSVIVTNAIFWGNVAPVDSQYNASTTSVYNSVIENYTVSSKGNIGTNPSLTGLASEGEYIQIVKFTGTSPVNIGLYVKRSKNSTGMTSLGAPTYSFYYSINGSTWFTEPTLTTAATNIPADVVDLTTTDATGYLRSGRPDAGAWEHR